MKLRSQVSGVLFGVLIGFSLISLFALSQGTQGGTQYNVLYNSYEIYIRNSSLLAHPGPIPSPVTSSGMSLVIRQVTAQGISSGSSITGTEYVYIYNTLAGNSTFTAQAEVITYLNGTVSVSSSPQLIEVFVSQGDRTQVVWAGYLQNQSSVSGYAYVNGSSGAVVGLVYLSGNGTVTVTHQFARSFTVSTQIVKDKLTVKGFSSHQVQIPVQFPHRYSPLVFNSTVNGTQVGAEARGWSVTVAYFNGTEVPALVWKAEGSSYVGFTGPYVGAHKEAKVNFSTIEFFGKNGTALGYVHNVYANETLSLSSPVGEISVQLQKSVVKFVEVVGVGTSTAEAVGKAYVKGQQVVVVVGSDGSVESTAHVNFSHAVFLNTSGVLTLVTVNDTASYIAVFRDNQTVNVTPVTPSKVEIVHFVSSDVTGPAQEVQINSSGFILVNVTSLGNNVVVFKETSQGNVTLNSSDYYIQNGHVYIFDDPSNTYYVVYPTTSTTSSSTSSSQASQSSSQSSSSLPSSTQYSSAPGQVQTTSSSSGQPSTTSTGPGSIGFLPLVAVIVVIALIVGIVVAFRRK